MVGKFLNHRDWLETLTFAHSFLISIFIEYAFIEEKQKLSLCSPSLPKLV